MTNLEATVVDPAPEKPILEQIFDEMFVQLAVHPDVSEGMLERVRQLAQSGQLKKPDKESVAEFDLWLTNGDR